MYMYSHGKKKVIHLLTQESLVVESSGTSIEGGSKGQCYTFFY